MRSVRKMLEASKSKHTRERNRQMQGECSSKWNRRYPKVALVQYRGNNTQQPPLRIALVNILKECAHPPPHQCTRLQARR